MYRLIGTLQTRTYSMDICRDDSGVLMRRPELKIRGEKTEHVLVEKKEAFTLLNPRQVRYDGEDRDIIKVVHNEDKGCTDVYIRYTVFKDLNLVELEKDFDKLLQEWFVVVIESDQRMSAWCRLHKKKPQNVNADDLHVLLYGQLNKPPIKIGTASISSGRTTGVDYGSHSITTTNVVSAIKDIIDKNGYMVGSDITAGRIVNT